MKPPSISGGGFPLDETLKFAGLLPPLRIPSHKPKVRVHELRPGMFREGFVLPDGRSVDVGLDRLLTLKHKAGANRPHDGPDDLGGTPRGRPRRAVPSRRGPGGIRQVKGAEEMLSDSRFNLKVATSRYGPDRDRLPHARRTGEPLQRRDGHLRVAIAEGSSRWSRTCASGSTSW